MQLDNKIGAGAQADVYLYNNQAIKLYNKTYNKSNIFYEALLNSIIQDSQIPIAEVHEVIRIGDRYGMKMDYIEGNTLRELYEEDKHNANTYIETLVDLQIRVHSQQVNLPIKMKDKLRHKISSIDGIDSSKKQKILRLLESYENGQSLCHGDFHWNNIIKSRNEYYVIDWIDATIGTKKADACKTYMLYLFHCQQYAELYLSIYCDKTGTDKEEVLKWLPIIVASRLDANIDGERDKIESILKDI